MNNIFNMNSFSLFLFLLISAASATPGLNKRQSAMNGLIESLMSSMNSFTANLAMKPARVTNITGEVNTRPGSKNKRFWYGPFNIPAAKVNAQYNPYQTDLTWNR